MVDDEYEYTVPVTESIEIAEEFTIPSHFRVSTYLKKTTERLRKQIASAFKNFLIWTNHRNGVIGLANVQQYAMLILDGKLISWQVQNALPGRGRGEASLKAIFKDGSQQIIVSGACYAFNPYANSLGFLTQRPVTFLSPFEN